MGVSVWVSAVILAVVPVRTISFQFSLSGRGELIGPSRFCRSKMPQDRF
jgi:hypothetical protein